ncbi:hypothetical protein PR202_ga21057 [Eleusine coracana subsp. coracana]|uniref:Uncharacterized protein n=1 Tax=Eleusine coracana subsp. coracana TaxID=191504 RepID=A0AAV5CYY9_ELECO|nr:hypothetical protein PR202_ga21057 [Eleusine coracana subsp. coracana]
MRHACTPGCKGSSNSRRWSACRRAFGSSPPTRSSSPATSPGRPPTPASPRQPFATSICTSSTHGTSHEIITTSRSAATSSVRRAASTPPECAPAGRRKVGTGSRRGRTRPCTAAPVVFRRDEEDAGVLWRQGSQWEKDRMGHARVRPRRERPPQRSTE